MKRILIIGGSGFLGRALYKELHPYFNVYATYCNQLSYGKNKRYFEYDFREDSPTELLKFIKPDLIISALRGEDAGQFVAHDMLIDYVVQQQARLIFLSAANVFDSFRHYPSYEHDKTFSESAYGKGKIKIETHQVYSKAEEFIKESEAIEDKLSFNVMLNEPLLGFG